MIELPHQLYLVNEGLFTAVLSISGLFREGLNSEFSIILQSDSQVNRSEIAFSYLPYGFKQLMEATLIQFGGQDISPFFKHFDVISVDLKRLLPSLKFKSRRITNVTFYFAFRSFPQYLED